MSVVASAQLQCLNGDFLCPVCAQQLRASRQALPRTTWLCLCYSSISCLHTLWRAPEALSPGWWAPAVPALISPAQSDRCSKPLTCLAPCTVAFSPSKMFDRCFSGQFFWGVSGVTSPKLTLNLFAPLYFSCWFLDLCELGVSSGQESQQSHVHPMKSMSEVHMRRCPVLCFHVTLPQLIPFYKKDKLFPSPLKFPFIKLLSYLLLIVLLVFFQAISQGNHSSYGNCSTILIPFLVLFVLVLCCFAGWCQGIWLMLYTKYRCLKHLCNGTKWFFVLLYSYFVLIPNI